jgi:hypothetical protein
MRGQDMDGRFDSLSLACQRSIIHAIPSLECPMTPAIERPLELPFTGPALREAVARRDIKALMAHAAQLRVAGYRVDAQRMAHDLLSHGCTWVNDSFGHRVSLQVHVPEALAQHMPDEAVTFRIAA